LDEQKSQIRGDQEEALAAYEPPVLVELGGLAELTGDLSNSGFLP
jgi:hypothetical protein